MKNKFSKKEILKMANNKNKEYQKLIKNKLNKNHILPGIKKILNEAKKNNLKMAIASSSFNAILILKKINLIDYFDYIVDPSSIKKGKPEPDIFLKACKGINIKPSEALGFEDSISGIIGLKKAKIKTIAITHNEIGE
jgi:beta-phosphoglucomutase